MSEVRGKSETTAVHTSLELSSNTVPVHLSEAHDVKRVESTRLGAAASALISCREASSK